MWNLWGERVDGGLPGHVRVIPDGSCEAGDGDGRAGYVQDIKVDYSVIQEYLEKARFLLDDPEGIRCELCDASMIPAEELVVVCPQKDCHRVYHLLCLSARFLSAIDNPDQLVPTHGTCPGCDNVVRWPLMMQELTLRCRAEKELQAVLRKKKRQDPKRKDDCTVPEPAMDPMEEGGLAEISNKSVPGECSNTTGNNKDREDSPLDETWIDEVLGSDVEAGDQLKTESKQPPTRTEIVIGDSDADMEISD